MEKNKVVIIGCGNVGMSYAYALVNQRTYVNELALIDLNQDRIEGEVMDLNHCLPYAPGKIYIHGGTYKDCGDADIVMIAAGANQKPGETRLDLINKNAAIFKDIIGQVMESGFNGIFLVATNPLDIMTYITYKYSGLKDNQVIGSGTSLDSARLRYNIGERIEINPKNIHAYVIGEHGDSEFIPWSNASVGLQSINDYLNEEDMKKIEDEVRNAAYEIINKKGATYYGIGVTLVRITNAILGDENLVFALSNYDPENNIYVSTPVVLNRKGVKKRIYIKLNDKETELMNNTIKVIKENIDKIN
ncbi:MAG: L-lactate dehydrogenase [Bacilli bacterium]|nr:L-lactate dehydrogenase [Bacilli bacterium]